MATHNTLTSLFQDIANKLRDKGFSGTIKADDFPNKIEELGTLNKVYNLPVNKAWRSVTHSPNKYIALATDGTIVYSTDKINWIAASVNGISGECVGISYGNGTFVCFAGQFAYSSDGINWVTYTPPAGINTTYSRNIKQHLYANGKFAYIVHESPSFYLSTDGINWALTSNFPTLQAYEKYPSYLGYVNNRYYALSYSTNGGGLYPPFYSADGGITWQRATFIASVPIREAYNFGFGGNKLVYLGRDWSSKYDRAVIAMLDGDISENLVSMDTRTKSLLSINIYNAIILYSEKLNKMLIFSGQACSAKETVANDIDIRYTSYCALTTPSAGDIEYEDVILFGEDKVNIISI